MQRISLMSAFAILFISTLLGGCVVAAVAGAAAGLVYDRRSVVTMEADARLFHIIHTAIVRDGRFRDSRILVTSFNRVVLLIGQTPSATLRALAGKKAEDAQGMARVYNEIQLGAPLPLKARTQDSFITSQVRSGMLAKKGLESGSIRIVTEHGVVYLMGIVSDEQAALAVDVARRINGVKKVIKIFQYIR